MKYNRLVHGQLLTGNSHKGFTLIELMVYMGLLGLLIVLMSQIFIATLKVKLESNRNSSLDQDGKFMVSRLTYDIHRATSITSPTLGQTASSVTFHVLDNGIDTTYQYASVSGNLIVTIGGTSTQLNSTLTKIMNFQVTRLGNSATVTGAKDTMSVSLTLGTTIIQPSGQLNSISYQTVLGLR